MDIFSYDSYVLQRQFLALTGKFRVYGPEGQLLLYSEQKIFKLKEDIRIYRDENKTHEVLAIRARQVIDFAAAYDVYDSATGEKLGTWRRKGIRSLMRDEWELLDAAGQPIGELFEDSLGLALLRRLLLGALLPQNYDLTMGGARVADLRQRFHIFRYIMDIDFRMDTQRQLDRRLGIAGGILLAAIEGKQSN